MIRSGTLVLEPATKADFDELFPVHSDPKNYEYEIIPPATKSSLGGELRRARYPKAFHRNRRFLFTIRKEEDSSAKTEKSESRGRLLGTCCLQLSADTLSGEIGILIHHEDQGKGHGSKAIAILTDWALRGLRLHRVYAAMDAKNKACSRIFEKIGYRQEADFQQWFHHPDRGWIDGLLFAMLRKDWDARDVEQKKGPRFP